MKFNRWACAFTLLFSAVFIRLEASSRANSESLYSAEAIGVTTFSYVDEERERPIKVEFWYPTDDLPKKTTYFDDVWIHPAEIRGAHFSREIKRTPLIIMSHGFGGDRRDRSWLAEILVRHGFSVASVDHFGNNWETMSIVESLKFWERPKDISFVLDRLLEEPLIRRRIDAERIGFAGYSLGGMTGLALAGAIPGEVESTIEKHKAGLPELTPEVISKVDFSEANRSFFDARIKGVLLLAPATFCFNHPEAIQSLKTPIALVATLTDEVLAFEDHFQPLIHHSIPARLKLLRNGVTHSIFLNRVTEKGRRVFQPKVYRDPPGVDRSEVHRDIGLFSVEFFRYYLNRKS